MFRSFIVILLIFFFCAPVSAHRLRWTETAQRFVDKYKIEIVYYPEELLPNAIRFNDCLECISFEKTHNIEVYKEHLYQVQYWIDYDKKYTYTKNYVGYDVFRNHIANYHKDKNYIMTQVYVNPTFYRKQINLVNDAKIRNDTINIARRNLNEHIVHIRDKINEYLN